MNIQQLADSTRLSPSAVSAIVKLLDEGATIPFIARYRKEMTQGATDEQLRQFEEAYHYQSKLNARKEDVLRLMAEKSPLTEALKASIYNATTLTEVEDLYRPYKDKKNTRAGMAISAGLTPVADAIERGRVDSSELQTLAKKHLHSNYADANAVIQGAQDILAERFSDSPKQRDILRQMMQKHGMVEVKASKQFDDKGVFQAFSHYQERANRLPAHRWLAIFRGVSEKQLNLKITIDTERYFDNIHQYAVPRNTDKNIAELCFDAYCDGYKRLLHPAIEREILNGYKRYADAEAIKIFAQNLKQLMMTPPVKAQAILGVDPGYRTGCKLAVVDANGDYLDHAVIYPTPPQNDWHKSAEIVAKLAKQYGIDTVAIGNGTGSQETQAFFADYNQKHAPLRYTVVSEAGASVYSASVLAQQEYPHLDVTIRGAISIAQRLHNPMSALVKIEPKALGIGQYQHDVDQKQLADTLHNVIEALVNQVGVNINTASPTLIAYVAGIGPKLAQAIVAHRQQYGAFEQKAQLLKVKGLGAKVYEQCSGFIRIPNAENILDRTGVHPESYALAQRLQQQTDVMSLTPTSTKALAQQWQVGQQTLQDIVLELQKPGFDPRDALPAIPFTQGITTLEQLNIGDVVSGVVRNITDFGVFVDIGLKNDGMIHISELAPRRIGHPSEVVSINQALPRIKVISIDLERGKVGLSLKQA